jgi:hypothetical protein
VVECGTGRSLSGFEPNNQREVRAWQADGVSVAAEQLHRHVLPRLVKSTRRA